MRPLIYKQIELNKQALKDRSALESGFRILVISTSKRDDATEAKATLMKNYPNQKSYMLYQSPHFKVLFGNFRNYKEADQFKKDLQVLFKDDLNIIPAQIEARGVREETDNL